MAIVIPTFAPAPDRDQSSSAANLTVGLLVPPFTKTCGLRPSYCVARLVKAENAGFFDPSRLTRPLCQALVGSSRRMNQMKIDTLGSLAAKCSAVRRYAACCA